PTSTLKVVGPSVMVKGELVLPQRHKDTKLPKEGPCVPLCLRGFVARFSSSLYLNNPKPVSFDFVSDPFLQSGRTTGEFAGSSSDLTAPKTKCASPVGIADPPGAKGEL